MAERLDPVGGWPAERVPGRSVPGVVLRYRRDGKWHCAPRVRAGSWWILPGPPQLSSRWSAGCVALAKAAGAHQVCGLKDPPACAGFSVSGLHPQALHGTQRRYAMKKRPKRLRIRRETVRRITFDEAVQAAGGATLTCPPTVGPGTCVTCLLQSRLVTC